MLPLAIHVILIAALVRALIVVEKPLICSGIYAAGHLAIGVMFKVPVTDALIQSGLALGAASIYFWLLHRFDKGLLWWLILPAGAGVALI